MNFENNGVGIFSFLRLKSLAFWSSQLQWRLPGRNEILLSRRNNKIITRDLCWWSHRLKQIKKKLQMHISCPFLMLKLVAYLANDALTVGCFIWNLPDKIVHRLGYKRMRWKLASQIKVGSRCNWLTAEHKYLTRF